MNTVPVGDVVPELVMLGGAVLVLVHALVARRDRQWRGAPLALSTLAAAAGLVSFRAASGGPTFTFSGTWAIDPLGTGAVLVILAVTAIVVVLSPAWFATDARHGEYYAVLLFSALGAIVMARAADLMELTFGIVLSSVTGYALAAYHRRSPASVEAGIKYFLIGAVTNALFLVGVALLYGAAGSTVYSTIRTRVANGDSTLLVAAAALLALGLAFKLGAVPAHAWMPDVADGAPAPVAAFLTAAPKVGAVIALARLMLVFPMDASGWRPLVAILAAVTMTVGNLAALWQDNVRRLLGWSAVSQTGYALMAVVALGRSAAAIPALLYFLIAYALGNLAAFGVVIELRGQADRLRYAALAREHPWLAAALVTSFLSFVGIPPLAGFVGKLALFDAVIDAGYGWLAVLAVANTVVSLAYYARVIGPLYFEPATGGASPLTGGAKALPVLGRWSALAIAVSTTGVITLGLAAEWVLAALRGARVLPG